MKNYWHYQKSLLGPDKDFLKPSRWDCPYIIRIGVNGIKTVYDTRQYADMNKIDHGYFGYSIVKNFITMRQAKLYVNKLMKE